MPAVIETEVGQRASRLREQLTGDRRFARTSRGKEVINLLGEVSRAELQRVVIGGRALEVLRSRARGWRDNPDARAALRRAKRAARLVIEVTPATAGFMADELGLACDVLEKEGAPRWRVESIRESEARLRQAAT